MLWYTANAAGLKYWFRRPEDLDPALCAAAVRLVREDDVIWDVGANVGLFSVVSAGWAGSGGSVVAIEPDPRLIRLLRRTARDPRNRRLAPITIVEAAVAAEPGVGTLTIAKRARAANALAGHGGSQMGGVRTEIRVPVVTLDGLCEKAAPPGLVKIDVEGAEAEVLRGGRILWQEHRPALILEVLDRNIRVVTRELDRLGYCMFDATQALTSKLPEQMGRAMRNTVAVHPASPLYARWFETNHQLPTR